MAEPESGLGLGPERCETSPSKCAGGAGGEEPLAEPAPAAAGLRQDEDSRWQPREAQQEEEEEEQGVCPGAEQAPAPPTEAGQDSPCLEGGAAEAGGGPGHPQPCQRGCGGQRCRAAVGGGQEPWPQQRQLGKKKHRRRPSKKKRHWKPYSKLSWEEKRKFDEKQSLRASRLRAEMFAKGQPVAPYNTTQFLMEDHDQEEPDLKTEFYPRRAAAKSDTSEEDFMEEGADEDGGSDGMGGDGSEFLQRDFSETYERYHVESLQNMSKQELIKEYLELEKCLSRMEDENNRLRMESKKYGGDSAEDTRVRDLELELDRLRAENLKLLKENELHRQQETPLPQFGE
ncbi:PREDICTED: protein HEXIM1-like [Crocodylus porosus]|uniref:protein HEXIM1-like n=1 Tax=Crocodylus porosus TaxID=8502 RepID=UPI00093905DA|nr:PREDICTED: protein HEXIM1-like [Crocodylus porosus]